MAGTIGSSLGDKSTDRFTNDDTQFLKFHGIYQQDDRDKRKTGKEYSFMIRTRTPGGVTSAEQYRVFDRLADQYGNQTMRLTTRQAFQFHGIFKSGLGATMRAINEALSTTLAACGDVARNVMAPPTPSSSRISVAVHEHARRLSDELLPETSSYSQIWVEGKQLDLVEENFDDPLYGKTYLPRKFKIGFAVPPLNDVDIFTHCLGFIVIEENGELVGYNLTVGGGLGMSHGNEATFPRKADVLGFVTPDKIEAVAKAVLQIHRDNGSRTDRRHARLKYVLADRGVDWFRTELEERIGFQLESARPFEFEKMGDRFGWYQVERDLWALGLWVENGRIKDVDGYQLKSALSKIVGSFSPEVRLTPSQSIILTGIQSSDKTAVDQIFIDHGIHLNRQTSPVRLASMSCPALPTCGLALAESERYLPDLLTEIESIMAELELADEEIIIRMTGCPNGCARPYMAEIGFVGRGPNKYQIYLGGDEAGTVLNTLYKENVKTDEMKKEIFLILKRFKKEREVGERLGDFSRRVLLRERVPVTD